MGSVSYEVCVLSVYLSLSLWCVCLYVCLCLGEYLRGLIIGWRLAVGGWRCEGAGGWMQWLQWMQWVCVSVSGCYPLPPLVLLCMVCVVVSVSMVCEVAVIAAHILLPPEGGNCTVRCRGWCGNRKSLHFCNFFSCLATHME